MIAVQIQTCCAKTLHGASPAIFAVASKPGRQRSNVSQLARGKTQTSRNPSRKSACGKISNGPP